MRLFLVNQKTNMSELDRNYQQQIGIDSLRRLIQHELAWNDLMDLKIKFNYGWMKQDLEIELQPEEFMINHHDFYEIFMSKFEYELRVKIDDLVMKDVNLARFLENHRIVMVSGIYEDEIFKLWR